MLCSAQCYTHTRHRQYLDSHQLAQPGTSVLLRCSGSCIALHVLQLRDWLEYKRNERARRLDGRQDDEIGVITFVSSHQG